MKRYKFIIKLSDGNEIQAASVGNSRDEAVERLLALPQTTDLSVQRKSLMPFLLARMQYDLFRLTVSYYREQLIPVGG